MFKINFQGSPSQGGLIKPLFFNQPLVNKLINSQQQQQQQQQQQRNTDLNSHYHYINPQLTRSMRNSSNSVDFLSEQQPTTVATASHHHNLSSISNSASFLSTPSIFSQTDHEQCHSDVVKCTYTNEINKDELPRPNFVSSVKTLFEKQIHVVQESLQSANTAPSSLGAGLVNAKPTAPKPNLLMSRLAATNEHVLESNLNMPVSPSSSSSVSSPSTSSPSSATSSASSSPPSFLKVDNLADILKQSGTLVYEHSQENSADEPNRKKNLLNCTLLFVVNKTHFFTIHQIFQIKVFIPTYLRLNFEKFGFKENMNVCYKSIKTFFKRTFFIINLRFQIFSDFSNFRIRRFNSLLNKLNKLILSKMFISKKDNSTDNTLSKSSKKQAPCKQPPAKPASFSSSYSTLATKKTPNHMQKSNETNHETLSQPIIADSIPQSNRVLSFKERQEMFNKNIQTAEQSNSSTTATTTTSLSATNSNINSNKRIKIEATTITTTNSDTHHDKENHDHSLNHIESFNKIDESDAFILNNQTTNNKKQQSPNFLVNSKKNHSNKNEDITATTMTTTSTTTTIVTIDQNNNENTKDEELIDQMLMMSANNILNSAQELQVQKAKLKSKSSVKMKTFYGGEVINDVNSLNLAMGASGAAPLAINPPLSTLIKMQALNSNRYDMNILILNNLK